MSQKIAKNRKKSQKIAGQQAASDGRTGLSIVQPPAPPPIINPQQLQHPSRISSSSFGCKLLIAKWLDPRRRFFLLETDEEAEATDINMISLS
jgi:hypothetical protein